MFCLSVQKKLAKKSGSRYQCELAKSKKIVTTLELAKLHLRVAGPKKLAMQVAREDETTDEDDKTEHSEGAPLADVETFMQHPFEENDDLNDE